MLMTNGAIESTKYTRNHLTSPRAKIVINESTEETTSRSDVAIHMRKVIVSYWGWRPTIASRYEFGVTNAEADKQAKIAAIIIIILLKTIEVICVPLIPSRFFVIISGLFLR